MGKKKFYFTFGTSPKFPHSGGWVEVIAETKYEAAEIFNKHYPPRLKDPMVCNCAFIYNQEKFEGTEMFKDGNLGAKCHAVLEDKGTTIMSYPVLKEAAADCITTLLEKTRLTGLHDVVLSLELLITQICAEARNPDLPER